jgi:hypothetical protein
MVTLEILLSFWKLLKLLPKYFTGYPPVDIFVHENVLTKNQIIKKLAKNKFKNKCNIDIYIIFCI